MKRIITMFMLLLCITCLASCKICDKNNECTEHVDTNIDGKCDVCGEAVEVKCTEHVDANTDGKCDVCGEAVEVKTPSIKDDYECISIAEAIEIAQKAGNTVTSQKYYVYGKIKSITSFTYGEMTIEDETGSLYIYGVYDKDQTTRYDAMDEKPVVGDEVVLYGALKTYNGTPEMDRGYLQAFNHIEEVVDDSEYEEMSVKNARAAEVNKKVKLTGVVARVTYAFGMSPNGFYLVDNTGSIYVYGKEVSGTVKEGNTVTVIGERTYYVLADEQNNANKHGYKGSCQIQNATLVENNKQVNDFDKSWIKESTVKQMLDTPVTEDITTDIYKVKAIVKKVVGTGFTNYYINDLDNATGSYTYTMCSGDDFTWLDQYDGKVCTVYLSIINAKAQVAGCTYRFIPVAVVEEPYEFDQTKSAQFVIDYYIKDKFISEYNSDPAISFDKEVSFDLINIIDAQVSFASDNENIIYFEETEDSIIFHTKDYGTAHITITVTNGSVVATEKLTIEVIKPVEYDTISVEEAIASEDGTEVFLKGIVVSSLVNQSGFYLSDDTGIVAVVANADAVAELSAGDEVVIKGTKTHRIKEGYLGAGQINIDSAEILVNYYGNHEYNTSYFDTTKTLNDLTGLSHLEDHTTEVYVVSAVVEVIETQYHTGIKIKSPDGKVSMNLYSSSASQYNFLKQYNGKEVTLELALCNWNGKNYYAGCVISVTYEGIKTINTLNFNE